MRRHDLRARETAIWHRLLDSVAANYLVLTLIKMFAIVGGSCAAGIGGGMEGPLTIAAVPTAKGLLVLGGVGLSGLGGLLLIAADRERPGLIGDVRRDLDALRDHIDLHDEMAERESWRLDCDNALRAMLDAVEHSLLHPAGSVEADIQVVLDISCYGLLDAFGVEDFEDYTLSIFRRDDAAQAMVRIAEQWYAWEDTLIDTRSWARGEGFTGQSWASRQTIGVRDALDAEARQIYTTPPTKTFDVGNADGVRPDAERYRSFACVPIMVGRTKEPWGIVTVTSDRIGRFEASATRSRGGDNIPVLKMAAAFLALLISAQP